VTKQVPYTVCKKVCTTKIVKVPHRICKEVPYTVTKCVPRVVCKQVPVTVCCPPPCDRGCGKRHCGCGG
jgi:hypothetical protein